MKICQFLPFKINLALNELMDTQDVITSFDFTHEINHFGEIEYQSEYFLVQMLSFIGFTPLKYFYCAL